MNRPCWLAGGACLVALLAAVTARADAQALPLSDVDPASIADREHARRVLDSVSRARREFDAQARAREHECHRRTLVNACLADVAAQRRAAESRLREIETRARTVIREARSAGAAEREAQRLDAQARRERARSAADRAGQREQSRERRRDERRRRDAARVAGESAQDPGATHGRGPVDAAAQQAPPGR